MARRKKTDEEKALGLIKSRTKRLEKAFSVYKRGECFAEDLFKLKRGVEDAEDKAASLVGYATACEATSRFRELWSGFDAATKEHRAARERINAEKLNALKAELRSAQALHAWMYRR